MNKPFLAAVVLALGLGAAGTRAAERAPRGDWATLSAVAAAPAAAPAALPTTGPVTSLPPLPMMAPPANAEPVPAPSGAGPAPEGGPTTGSAPVPQGGHGPVPGPGHLSPVPGCGAACGTCCHGPGSCLEHLWAWATFRGNRTACCSGGCGGCCRHCHSCDGYHCFPPLYLFFLHPCVEGSGASCADCGHAGH